MSADRLVKEFKAQDVGAWLVCHIDGIHVRVASWNNANQCWDVLPEGHNLLNPQVVEEVQEPTQMERLAAKSGLRKPRAVEKVTAGELSID